MPVIEEPYEGNIYNPDSFKGLKNAEQTNAAVRAFSALASRYETQLIRHGYAQDQINEIMGGLKTRLAAACEKFGVPLTSILENHKNRNAGE